MHRLRTTLCSPKFTVYCLILAMLLVVMGTLDQVELGIFAAKKRYFDSFFIYSFIPGSHWRIPVFPGGATVGTLLLLNLVAIYSGRFMSDLRRKKGLLLTHVGLILLGVGGFIAAFRSVESRMVIEEGGRSNYCIDSNETEIVFVDASAVAYDDVISVPQNVFEHTDTIRDDCLPFTVKILKYFPNSLLSQRKSEDPPSLATHGIGPGIHVESRRESFRDDETNVVTAFVEILDRERSIGIWLVSNVLTSPQTFDHNGTSWSLALRRLRYYLPYSLTLKDFRFDRYPGTGIPRNFSSLVHLDYPQKDEDRDALIYMNHPLRYEGRAFYQSSYGKNETLTELQVVQNPGWMLPYVACSMISMGLLFHFMSRLSIFLRRRP